MAPDRIIIVADPVGRLLFQVRQRRPWAGVDQLFLVSREEGFRYRIVVADSCPSQRPPDSILRTVGVEYRGCVLAAAVRMEDDPGGRLTRGEGHIERGGDQAGPHVRGDGPANDFAGIKVDDGREISPSVPCSYVGDVAAPLHISEGGGEIPADQVRGRDRLVPADRGPLPRLRMTSLQASGLHEPVDA